MSLYSAFFTLVFRRMNPETAHHLAFRVIRAAPLGGAMLRRWCAPSRALRVQALGQVFPSPFGLAAGFDKNAEGILGLGAFGFGHVEVGTLTRHAQEGNPRPRMFRLVSDRGLINRMGFNNGGSASAVPRIERARLARHRPVIGVNIGKSRVTEVADATSDYVWSAERLAPLADYLAINVSSPNTPGLRGLQELDSLEPLLIAVQEAAQPTPVLVKIAPDMDDEQIIGITQLAVRLGLAGVIATNTTVSREGLQEDASVVQSMGAGGLSGRPLRQRALEGAALCTWCGPRPTVLCDLSRGSGNER